MPTVDSIIDQLRTLPLVPRILPQLLTALGREQADADEVVRLIAFDPALTVQVLRRCNSTGYGFPSRTQDLQEAVMRIGMVEIYRIVACLMVERLLDSPQPGYGIGQGELWKHCAVSALAAKVIAHELGGDESVVFTAALLHDIGKLVLSTALEGAYGEVLVLTGKSHLSFLEAEKDVLGVQHAEVGGRLLERWNFPDPLARAVRHHHDPIEAKPAEELAAYIHLGDVLAHLLGHGYGHHAYAVRCRSEALDILGIKAADLEQFLIKTSAGVEEMLSPKPAAA